MRALNLLWNSTHHEEHEENKELGRKASELRDLRVLRGENILTINWEERLI
jgi:hypothetical protein